MFTYRNTHTLFQFLVCSYTRNMQFMFDGILCDKDINTVSLSLFTFRTQPGSLAEKKPSLHKQIMASTSTRLRATTKKSSNNEELSEKHIYKYIRLNYV